MEATTPASRPTDRLPRARALIDCHGEFGPLFRIFIVNVALSVITLGFYRFWAKTRMRRYLWGHVRFEDEDLEYTGTGRELFLGFLFVVFVVLIPLFGGMEMVGAVLVAYAPEWAIVPDVVQTAAIVFLIPVAIYRARRYRLSRTVWRGVRGGQTGSAWAYGGLSVLFYALSLLSIGLAWPACSTRLTAYKTNNTWFGDRRLGFAAGPGPLYKTFLAVWGTYLALFVAFAAVIAILDIAFSEVAEGIGVFLAFVVVVVASVFGRLPWYWYRAAEIRYFTAHTEFENLCFSAEVSGFRLALLTVTNAALTVLTLGFALPYVYLRYLRFFAERLRMTGEQDFAAIVQSALERPRIGEGLADAFDVGEF